MENAPPIPTTTKIRNTIKDSIRRKGKQKLPHPDCACDLRALILAQKPIPKCNCDICDPHFYRVHWNCKIHPHQHPKLKYSIEKNKFGNECYQPLKLNSVLRGEAMEIARAAIQYFDRPVESLNDTQLAVVEVLQTWIRQNMSIWFTERQFDEADLSTLLPAVEMRKLWNYTHVLFFGCKLSSSQYFVWNAQLREDALGIADRRWWRNTIEMTPLHHDFEYCNSNRVLNAIGTLLHEVCHAFFNYYACFSCWSTEWNLNALGHGRAWQLLASAAQTSIIRFTGLPVDLGAFDSLRTHWEYVYPLPSPHDLDDWGFGTSGLVQIYARDLQQAIYDAVVKEGKKVEEFPLRGFAEYWWVDTQEAEKKLREMGWCCGGTERNGTMVCGGVVEADGYEFAGRKATVSGEMSAECECGEEVDKAE
jgi:hypothetical protein